MSKDIFVDDEEELNEKTAKAEKPTAKQKKKTEVEKENEDKKVENNHTDNSGKYYYVELPSNGVLDYPRTVEHRDVLWKDQKTLSSATDQTFKKTLNKVVKSILNNADWFENMTIIDRDYVLVWVFVNNFSTTKPIEFTCPECDNVDSMEYDIRDLSIDEISEDYKEPFEIPLQNSKKVWVRLPRVSDELKVDEFLRKNDSIKEDPDTLALYETIDVGYELPLKAKIKWIEENFTAKDMAMVREFNNHFKYGLNDIIEHECSACGEVVHGRFPFRLEEIFSPSVQNDFESILQANKGA